MPLEGVRLGASLFTSSTSLLKNGMVSSSDCIKMESTHETPLEMVREHSNGKPGTLMLKARHSGPALPLDVATYVQY